MLELASFGATEQIIQSEDVPYGAIVHIIRLYEFSDTLFVIQVVEDDCNPPSRIN